MGIKKLIMSLLWLGIVGLMIYYLWGRSFLRAYDHYQQWNDCRNHLEAVVGQVRNQVMHKKYFIKKMMGDAHFREQVAREQVGFLKDHEYVIYFKNKEYLGEKPKVQQKF